MKKRNPFLVVVFTVFTLGFYLYYYLYQTAKELQKKFDSTINPLLDILLIVIGCSPYILYIFHRNLGIVDIVMYETQHRSKKIIVLFLALAPLLLLVPFIVMVATETADSNPRLIFLMVLPMYILPLLSLAIHQMELNKLIGRTRRDYESVFE